MLVFLVLTMQKNQESFKVVCEFKKRKKIPEPRQEDVMSRVQLHMNYYLKTKNVLYSTEKNPNNI